MNRILRFEVPIDDQWHQIPGHGGPLHVGCRDPRFVEFWAWESNAPGPPVEYRVFGTGQPVEEFPGGYIGTVVAPCNRLVWHLMSRS